MNPDNDQNDEVRQLMALIRRYDKALGSLTPGGSEFHNSPEAQAEFARMRLNSEHQHLIAERMKTRSLQTQLSTVMKLLSSVLGIVRRLEDVVYNDGPAEGEDAAGCSYDSSVLLHAEAAVERFVDELDELPFSVGGLYVESGQYKAERPEAPPWSPGTLQMTCEEAVLFADRQMWKFMSDRAIFELQINQRLCCMDFGEFHRCTEAMLGRPVWSHEFAHPENLIAEYQRKMTPPTMEDTMAQLPAERTVVISAGSESS
jgi:hypothetical protein